MYACIDAAGQLPPVSNLRRFLAEGADLVSFSGGKAIGGPQGSGILAGKRDLLKKFVAAHDEFGPGKSVPALLLARSFTRSGVDHTYMDTLSIMRTIELQWSLGNLGQRDRYVNSLANAISTGRPVH